jgi:hypothetical protein
VEVDGDRGRHRLERHVLMYVARKGRQMFEVSLTHLKMIVVVSLFLLVSML